MAPMSAFPPDPVNRWEGYSNRRSRLRLLRRTCRLPRRPGIPATRIPAGDNRRTYRSGRQGGTTVCRPLIANGHWDVHGFTVTDSGFKDEKCVRSVQHSWLVIIPTIGSPVPANTISSSLTSWATVMAMSSARRNFAGRAGSSGIRSSSSIESSIVVHMRSPFLVAVSCN